MLFTCSTCPRVLGPGGWWPCVAVTVARSPQSQVCSGTAGLALPHSAGAGVLGGLLGSRDATCSQGGSCADLAGSGRRGWVPAVQLPRGQLPQLLLLEPGQALGPSVEPRQRKWTRKWTVCLFALASGGVGPGSCLAHRSPSWGAREGTVIVWAFQTGLPSPSL